MSHSDYFKKPNRWEWEQSYREETDEERLMRYLGRTGKNELLALYDKKSVEFQRCFNPYHARCLFAETHGWTEEELTKALLER